MNIQGKDRLTFKFKQESNPWKEGTQYKFKLKFEFYLTKDLFTGDEVARWVSKVKILYLMIN